MFLFFYFFKVRSFFPPFSFFKLYKRSPGCERNLRQHTNKCRFASNLKLPSIFPQTTRPTWFLDLILEGVWFWRWSQNEFVSLPSLSSQHQLFRWWAALIFSSFQILRPHAPLSLHSTKKTTLITNDKQPVTSSLKRTRLNLYNQGEKRMVISHLLWEGMKDRRSLGKNRIQPSWRRFFPPPLPRTSLLPPPRTPLLLPPSRFSPYLRIITSDMLTLLPCLLCYVVRQHPFMFDCK